MSYYEFMDRADAFVEGDGLTNWVIANHVAVLWTAGVIGIIVFALALWMESK